MNRLDMKKSKKIKYINIFDVDGVLACSAHRYKTIETKKGLKIDLDYWRSNEHLCVNDSLLPTAELYKKLLAFNTHFVIVATSRILKPLDYDFIDKNIGLPDAIVSRLHNKQKGHDLKINGILRIIQDCNLSHVDYKNITVYEDNIHYLKGICDYFQCKGVYIPSKQGH